MIASLPENKGTTYEIFGEYVLETETKVYEVSSRDEAIFRTHKAAIKRLKSILAKKTAGELSYMEYRNALIKLFAVYFERQNGYIEDNIGIHPDHEENVDIAHSRKIDVCEALQMGMLGRWFVSASGERI